MRIRNTITTKLMTAILLFGALSFTATSCSGGGKKKDGEEHHEHPEGDGHEHPEGEDHEHPEGDGKEHPEDKKGEKEASTNDKPLTIEEFADAAKDYINKRTKKNGGNFPVKDEKQDKTLKLELKKVHRKRLSHLGYSTYFVCADFKAQDGTTYDVDIFMTGTNKENLKEAKKPMVHKVDGNARFTYVENDGVWERKMKKDKKG